MHGASETLSLEQATALLVSKSLKTSHSSASPLPRPPELIAHVKENPSIVNSLVENELPAAVSRALQKMEFSRNCAAAFDTIDKDLSIGRERATSQASGRSRAASSIASASEGLQGSAVGGSKDDAMTGLVHPNQGSGALYDAVMDLLSACTWVPNVDVYQQVCSEFKDSKHRDKVSPSRPRQGTEGREGVCQTAARWPAPP